MIAVTRTLLLELRCGLVILLVVLFTSGCATSEKQIQYPFFDARNLKGQAEDCGKLDHYLQQVDSIRWSMRKDGIELETRFEQMVQLSLATAGAIALAPVTFYTPQMFLSPYGMAYTNPDKLKYADALLIALLSKRQQLGCEPHSRCKITGDDSGTLSKLRDTRKRVESGKTPEEVGLSELTSLLDDMCPVGDIFTDNSQL